MFVEVAYQAVHRHWHHQVAAAGPDATRTRLRSLIPVAESLGFSTNQQVLRYINVCYALGDAFSAEFDWARLLLERPNLSPEVRIALLVEKTEDWLNGIAVD
jgi:hypothetical protein